MIKAYTLDDHDCLSEIREPSDRMLDEAVWVDLLDPSQAELDNVEKRFGEVVPRHVKIGEIEATSRFNEDSTGIQFQLQFLDHSPEMVRNTHVAFALRGERLVSLHERDLAALTVFLRRVRSIAGSAGDATSIFLGILESEIDHLADTLEANYEHLEELSRATLADKNPDLEETLGNLTRIAELNGKIRINLMDAQQVVSGSLRSARLRQTTDRLSEVLRDVESLLAHTTFLLERIGLLTDTVMGLISIRQNDAMKILSVISAVFLPLTLVASIYGMNFKNMPELSWSYGYPFALIAMLILGITPLWYARRRGWM